MTKQQPSSFFHRIKNLYKSNLLPGRFILTLTILIVTLGIVRISLPYTIIYSATSWLKQQGIDSSIETININIINGTVSLINAKGSKNSEPLFDIGLIDIHWRWTPLSEKTIVVTKVALDHFNVKIEKYTDEIIIGGVVLPLNTTTETVVDTNKDEDQKPWAAAFSEIVFTNLDICYMQHTTPRDISNDESKYVDYCINLDEMSWGGIISYATDAALLKTDDTPLSSTGNFTLNGLTITDNKLDSKLAISLSNTLKNIVISGLKNIHIDSLEMIELSALQRNDDSHKDSVHFQKLLFNDITFSNLNSLSIGSVDIIKPGFYLVKNNDQLWEYQQWIPKKSTAEPTIETTDINASPKPASPLKVSINTINIEKIDSCYLEKENSLNYCFSFDALLWDGNIKYDSSLPQSGDINLAVTGDLTLTQLTIRNNTLDRNLLNFDSLVLTNINLSGLNSITLDSIQLNNFAALQRGQKQNDNTVAFKNLAINNIIYSKNSVSLNTINLDGLSETVSKNPDGSWEHDKWLIKKDSVEKSNDDKTPAGPEEQPFVISLKQLLVTSDKKLQFIDNSTKPTMKMGLQSLLLDIKNIDSTRPNQNSPIHLSAKTLLHSTINIDGTARPLAKKVSFNLDGKLKGFDLRAASPATNKAIGHIIKSGQLDADLKLHATDGELDSNIALSLYQFHIKAKSKEDAEKLDALLGMPLNQTLALLRDKDDSIHLDIPITGDINNPSFNPMDTIVKATTKAATVTLITFYTPYGLIYAGGNVLFDLTTAMNFDPISFEPGSAEIHADNKQKLENLNKLLTEKPGIHLTLCGVTNPQDALSLYPELKKQQTDNNKIEINLSKEQLSALEQLARDRQINAKNYLIKENNIAHDRLILCAPEHKADQDAVAGIEINI